MFGKENFLHVKILLRAKDIHFKIFAKSFKSQRERGWTHLLKYLSKFQLVGIFLSTIYMHLLKSHIHTCLDDIKQFWIQYIHTSATFEWIQALHHCLGPLNTHYSPVSLIIVFTVLFRIVGLFCLVAVVTSLCFAFLCHLRYPCWVAAF
jgi:hypothetical protein